MSKAEFTSLKLAGPRLVVSGTVPDYDPTVTHHVFHYIIVQEGVAIHKGTTPEVKPVKKGTPKDDYPIWSDPKDQTGVHAGAALCFGAGVSYRKAPGDPVVVVWKDDKVVT